MGLLPRTMLALGWASLAVAAATSDTMGPAAFMWPPDRVWNAEKDNTAPCGSPAKAGDRTEFPLTNGKIALVDQDEGYDLKVSVSYANDPASNADFSVLIPSQNVKEILLGHTCLPLPDAPRDVDAGTNATFQIIYTADFDKPENQTFYACADITYVLESDFTTDTGYCFNATEPSSGDGTGTTTGGHGAATETAQPETGGTSRSRLSGGAIAGIVIGSVAGAAMLAAAALWYYRRRQQQKRIDAMTRSSRNVAWENQLPAKGKDSTSQNSVRLQDM